MSVYLSVYASLCQTIVMDLAGKSGLRNRTATAVLRPQTGFEDRPGHQAHAFRAGQSLFYRLPVAPGEDSDVAGAAGYARGVGVLEPGLGKLAAGAEAVAQAGQ